MEVLAFSADKMRKALVQFTRPILHARNEQMIARGVPVVSRWGWSDGHVNYTGALRNNN